MRINMRLRRPTFCEIVAINSTGAAQGAVIGDAPGILAPMRIREGEGVAPGECVAKPNRMQRTGHTRFGIARRDGHHT
jgi:hypothetical protein